MKHRFLVHFLNHTVLLVDISEIGVATQIYPPEGKPQAVSSLRFQSLRDAEQYLVGLGAGRKLLDMTIENVRKTGATVLSIT